MDFQEFHGFSKIFMNFQEFHGFSKISMNFQESHGFSRIFKKCHEFFKNFHEISKIPMRIFIGFSNVFTDFQEFS